MLVGLGVAAGSFGIVLAAFARNVTAEQRSFAFGIGTAAGSAGMFLFAPLSQALIDSYGWSDSAAGHVGDDAARAAARHIRCAATPRPAPQSQAEIEQTMGAGAAARPSATKSYLLLTSGFFVCGFQVAFITAHFPAYLARYRHRRRAMR